MDDIACACGCGKRVSQNRFVQGHNWKGKRRGQQSEEHRRKMSESLKGRKLSDDHRKKMSESQKGRVYSAETREKMSRSLKGHSVSEKSRQKMSARARSRWSDPGFRSKTMKVLTQAQHISPNKPEKKLLWLLDKHFPGEWKFVGDGAVIFNGYNPDFINVNGKKLIIEMFGDYWHKEEDPANRARLFAPFGFRTLVIWEHELENLLVVHRKISGFIQ